MEEKIELLGGEDFTLNDDEFKEWKSLLKLGERATAQDFILAASTAGDSVMYRMWTHVKDDNGNIYEQMDRNTGKQISAKDLTWSFANILHAYKLRTRLKIFADEYRK